jgi:hypothetical protein
VPAARDGRRIQPQQFGHAPVPAMTVLQAFQAGEEPALLFVEQTVEQREGRRQLVGLPLPRRPLFLPAGAIGGTIKVALRARPALQPAALHQLAQRILDRHQHQRLQLVGKIARRRAAGQFRRRVEQRPLTGKMNVAARPQAVRIEARECIERVIGAAMRVAAAVVQLGQAAKHRALGRRRQRFLQFW